MVLITLKMVLDVSAVDTTSEVTLEVVLGAYVSRLSEVDDALIVSALEASLVVVEADTMSEVTADELETESELVATGEVSTLDTTLVVEADTMSEVKAELVVLGAAVEVLEYALVLDAVPQLKPIE